MQPWGLGINLFFQPELNLKNYSMALIRERQTSFNKSSFYTMKSVLSDEEV